jgi:hypothetical protein
MHRAPLRLTLALLGAACCSPARGDDRASFHAAHCTACHDADRRAGRLDLTALAFKPDDPANARIWVRVHDRVAAGEMPPKKADAPEPAARDRFVRQLAAGLTAVEEKRVAAEGRATRRRLNRQEYEYAVRDLLGAPWLPLREVLPQDAVAHGYNTVGDALDVSHVQIARYLQAAEVALTAVSADPPRPTTHRYYAREQRSFVRRMTFTEFNTSPERATFPVLGTAAQPDVRAGKAPMTVGAADPTARELEGVGLVHGAYEPVQPTFDQFKAASPGRYRLRFRALTVWVGPNGANANLKNPGKLTLRWFIPNFDDVRPGRRAEPVTVYAEQPPRQLRRLGAFDVSPEPGTHELDVYLLAGETIRPDAARLFRSRPGEARIQNPFAEADGQPGVVYRWLEVEGPLPEPGPTGRQRLFGDLPVKNGEVIPANPKVDAERRLRAFVTRAYRRPVPEREQVRFLPLVERRLAEGASFKDAMLTGYTAVLCSPEFLTLHADPGPLDDFALASRLSFFLWNSAPDDELRAVAARGELRKPDVLRKQTQRLLDDPRSGRFVSSFLDYWLDLRKVRDNSPDAGLYGDYYLDDLLTDSAVEETRLYFAEMLRTNLPARAVAAADFAFVNERLAAHYGLPKVDGVALRKVALPKDSVRGGLLTQASVLTVTANGTTTSPVVRGAWVLDRILGTPPQPPPPSVPAVEPDLRGAHTIREQLATHRTQAACAACHKTIDPPGFALECFDVMGGFRTKYRAVAEKPERSPGIGKNGQPFQHRDALPVDTTGELPDGRAFKDVSAFKAILAADDRQLGRNLVRQLTVYATGAPVSFRDRAAVEAILDKTKAGGYRTADLVHELVQSELFRNK